MFKHSYLLKKMETLQTISTRSQKYMLTTYGIMPANWNISIWLLLGYNLNKLYIIMELKLLNAHIMRSLTMELN